MIETNTSFGTTLAPRWKRLTGRLGAGPLPRLITTLALGLAAISCDTNSFMPGVDQPGTSDDGTTVQIQAVAGQGQTGSVAEMLPAPLTVKVTSTDGAPLGGASVRWSFAAGGGSRSKGDAKQAQLTSVTGDDGLTSVYWQAGTSAGDQQALATLPSVSGAPTAKFGSHVKPGHPDVVTVSPDGTTLGEGESMLLTATVSDKWGNDVPDAEVSWTSDATSVVQITPEGVATGVSAGSATITAIAENASRTVTLVVEGTAAPAPHTVSDLTAVATTAGSVTLSWTQVDDGTGGPARYALRYGTPTLEWAGAAASEVTLAGTGVGSSLQHTVSGLEAGTAYQFAVAAYRGTPGVDAVTGPVSKVASATTDAAAATVAVVHATPGSASLVSLGETATFAAVALDGAGAAVNGVYLQWKSLDEAVATVSATGTVTAVANGTARITVSAACCSAADTVTISVAQVAATVTLTPASLSLPMGGSSRLAAAVADARGHTVADADITWTSSDASVIGVDGNGLVSAIGVGGATITATSGAASGTASVASLAPPPAPLLPARVTDLAVASVERNTMTVSWTQVDDGTGMPAKYLVRYGSPTISWASASATEVSVTGAGIGTQAQHAFTGLAAATQYQVQVVAYRGSAGADAVLGPLSNVASGTTEAEPLPVTSVTAAPATLSLTALGATGQLGATAKDGAGHAVSGVALEWHSLDEAVATVDATGEVTANAKGTARITVTATCCAAADTVTVSVSQVASKVTVSPAGLSLTAGGISRLTASVSDANGFSIADAPISWSSTAATVATVDATGLVKAVAEGSATIKATSGSVTGTADVSVAAAPLTDPASVTDLSVVAVTDSTITVRWTQVDDGAGNPAKYALRYGSPTINWGPASVTEVSVAGNEVGATRQYTFGGLAAGTAYQFRLVAYRGTLMVDAEFGALSNVASGNTEQAEPPVAAVTVSPSSLSFSALGSTAQLSVTAESSAGSATAASELEWRSLDPTVATVDQSGRVTAVENGSAAIVVSPTCCTAADTVSVEVSQVADEITISPSQLELQVGGSTQLKALVADANGNAIDSASVSWHSDGAAIATCDVTGHVSALAEGDATVTASSDQATSTVPVSVTAPTEVTDPAAVSDLVVKATTDNSVTLTWTQVDDGAGSPATYALRYGSPTINWGPASDTEVTVEGTQTGSKIEYTFSGLTSGTQYQFMIVAYRGTLRVDATFGTISSALTASTTGSAPKVPTTIQLSPSSLSLQIGGSATALATVRDQFGAVMSGVGVTWSSVNAGIATVNTAGKVTAVSAGSTQIKATAEGATNQITVSVTDPTPPPSSNVHHPHEPTGYTPVADNPFDQLEPNGWHLYPAGTPNLRIETDAGAKLSPSNVGAAVFDAGRKGGSGPMTLSYANFAGKRSVYVHFGYKVSSNWYNHSAGTKILFLTDPTLGASAPFYLVMFGAGDGSLRFQVDTQSIESGSLDDASGVYGPNAGGDDTILRGKWYDIELVFRLNHIGNADGEIHGWINGKKVIQYTGLEIVGSKSDGTLNTVKWNPTYGGGSYETVPATQYQYMDHLYISGSN